MKPTPIKQRKCKVCETPFTPHPKGLQQVYCSQRCRDRATRMRRQRLVAQARAANKRKAKRNAR